MIKELHGPHYRFWFAGEIVARYGPTGRLVRVELPEVHLAALSDDPNESEAAVYAALGEAVCEVWCTLACVASDERHEWAECLTHYERLQGLTLVRSLTRVQAHAGGSGASHERGRMVPERDVFERRDLANIGRTLQAKLRVGGVFGGNER